MSTKTHFSFPVGYYQFHRSQLFNFQLNRWHSLGYLSLDDMKALGAKIHSFEEWKNLMSDMAAAALAQNRLIEAAFFTRAEEFYTPSSNPDKEPLYDRFIELFYGAFEKDRIKRDLVPYDGGFLPAMVIPPDSGPRQGVIVIHGGFDSFIEEFYSMMRFMAARGFEVVAFEGPGQGGARRKYNLAFDYRWEKPVKAVLDHFKLDNVTLLGISMGGYLCFRAAAYEPRIKRVIASSVAYDYSQIPGRIGQAMNRFFFSRMRRFTNRMARLKMSRGGIHAWSIGNLMYITKAGSPVDAMDDVLEMNQANLHSDMVKQDVLILTGKEDHFIPFKMHDMQMKALVNASSVVGRVFDRDEQAQNHCQIGNIGLALEVMMRWIEENS